MLDRPEPKSQRPSPVCILVVDWFFQILELDGENKRWLILEAFYTSDSRGDSNRQPHEGVHVFLTCQQGSHPTGFTSTRYSHTTSHPTQGRNVCIPSARSGLKNS
jgi:hypothetical protein